MPENKLYKIMVDLLHEANTLSAVQVVLRSLDDNADQISQRIEHSPFFAVVKEACWQTLYLSTGKIFDEPTKYKETSSLKSLTKAVCQVRSVDINEAKANESITAINDFLGAHDIAGTLKRIKEIRHQVIAHKQTEPEQKAKDITINEIHEFIDKTFVLLNQVADGIGFHGTDRITRGSTVKDSTQSVMYSLYHGRQFKLDHTA